ncbi:hypothetical protein OIU78_002610 [Salix suchowensis]|nr:hypothetical protein OIU78_002610 [Salix suchowensis]
MNTSCKMCHLVLRWLYMLSFCSIQYCLDHRSHCWSQHSSMEQVHEMGYRFSSAFWKLPEWMQQIFLVSRSGEASHFPDFFFRYNFLKGAL